jgi:hypothetical protein
MIFCYRNFWKSLMKVLKKGGLITKKMLDAVIASHMEPWQIPSSLGKVSLQNYFLVVFALDCLTVEQLKILLEKYNLTKTGNRDVLILRLRNHIQQNLHAEEAKKKKSEKTGEEETE